MKKKVLVLIGHVVFKQLVMKIALLYLIEICNCNKMIHSNFLKDLVMNDVMNISQ